jgi:hypothetical protein
VTDRGEIRVRLQVWGTLDPALVSAAAGCNADRFLPRATPLPGPDRASSEDCWVLEAGPELAAIEDGIHEILGRLNKEAAVGIARLVGVTAIEFACDIRAHGSWRPQINLSRGTIQAMADLGSELDIDLYWFD